MSKKLRRREEQERLLAEAQKSEVDSKTGRVRCLSCGSVFRSLNALASHLEKHGGVNSPDFRPAKIVGSSQNGKIAIPMTRPSTLFSLESWIQNPKQHLPKQKSHVKTSRHKTALRNKTGDLFGEEDESLQKLTPPSKLPKTKKKKQGLTMMKRCILVNRVLALTHTLDTIEAELKDLERSSTRTAKENKRLSGCQNRTLLELNHALVALNQRFTFRQIIMLEFLFSGTEASLELANDIKICKECQPDSQTLQLYQEVEQLTEQLEFNRTEEEDHSLVKNPPSADIVHADFKSDNHINDNEVNRDTVTEEEMESVESSSAESSDDELWGFGDVLSQWAKKVQHKPQNQMPERKDYNLLLTNIPMPEEETVEPSNSEDVGIKLVHAKKKKRITLTKDMEEDKEEWTGDIKIQTMFIRPHLMIKERSENTQEQKKPKTETRHSELQKEADSLQDIITIMLKELNELQHAQKQPNCRTKWMLSGFSEVSKALKSGNLELVVLANNLDVSLTPQIDQVLTQAEEKNVLVFKALSRRKLGQIYHPRKRMSIIGITQSPECQPFVMELRKLQANDST